MNNAQESFYSDTLKVNITPEFRAKFFSNVNVLENECWIWRGTVSKDGYGKLKRGKKTLRAHRVSVVLSGREIPPRMCACHRCDVRLCVNPNHLWVGTNDENMADMVAKKRAVNVSKKLTEEMVLWLRKTLPPKSEVREISKRIGVSVSTLMKAISGESWPHLPPPDVSGFRALCTKNRSAGKLALYASRRMQQSKS